jgi:predicted GIY-YIG superfamily endonuclease
MRRWWVYIIEKNGGYYVGITTDPPNRLRQHDCPASYHLKGPFLEQEAVNTERRLKRLTRQEKRDLIKGSSQQ